MSQTLSEMEIERLNEYINNLHTLLSGRAGKLLKKGKPFIVIAEDETYFTEVYLVIRESEKAKGSWTEECEARFQELTNYDENGRSFFPMASPELQSVMREQIENRKMQDENKQLQLLLKDYKESLGDAVKRLRHRNSEIERLRNLLIALKTSRNLDGSVNQDMVLTAESYEWMAEKVREYSDIPSDYMALAASEFEKIAEALKTVEGSK